MTHTRLVLPCCILGVLFFSEHYSRQPPQRRAAAPKIQFEDIATRAGLISRIVQGGEKQKKYILETTGTGVAIFDFDGDGFRDIFFANGSRTEGFPPGEEPINHLYRNQGDGSFQDVTGRAGLARSGWGQGVCAADYDNDGDTDLLATYFGHDVLYRNEGNGTFKDWTQQAGLPATGRRWGTGCAFLDYDRDGDLDLFVANYVVFDEKTVPQPGSNQYCQWKGIPVMCGPRGLKGGTNLLYRNNGDGTFTDVSERSGIAQPGSHYGLTAIVSDFDDDCWPDIYVACDSSASLLYHNNRDGTFSEIGELSGTAYNADGRAQAGMGVSVADYDGDGRFDLVKTNFADDTSTLYHNEGRNLFNEVTAQAGLGDNTKYLGWGVAFLDIDHDGWKDILIANGHVYPEVEGNSPKETYRQRKLVYWNQGGGAFRDISAQCGPAITELRPARGMAVADLDNDGRLEVVVSNMNDPPSLLKNFGETQNSILIELVGTQSNRSAIGAKVTLRSGRLSQTDEVRSGGSYISQNDLRLHFGLGRAGSVDQIEIRWPAGETEKVFGVKANQWITVKEGTGVVKQKPFVPR